jgi:allophanate hydrolase subunit 1
MEGIAVCSYGAIAQQTPNMWVLIGQMLMTVFMRANTSAPTNPSQAFMAPTTAPDFALRKTV